MNDKEALKKVVESMSTYTIALEKSVTLVEKQQVIIKELKEKNAALEEEVARLSAK